MNIFELILTDRVKSISDTELNTTTLPYPMQGVPLYSLIESSGHQLKRTGSICRVLF